MKNLSLRNMLILLGAVIIALLALGFVSTLLNQIIPITIALIAGLVLGRLSIRVDLLAAARTSLRRDPTEQPAADQAEQATEEPAPIAADLQADADAIKARLEDKEASESTPEITDFEIKTEEEILTEARQREAELASKKADYDPAAALAERRRRLLGEDTAEG